jgi:hypothetical protein
MAILWSGSTAAICAGKLEANVFYLFSLFGLKTYGIGALMSN